MINVTELRAGAVFPSFTKVSEGKEER